MNDNVPVLSNCVMTSRVVNRPPVCFSFLSKAFGWELCRSREVRTLPGLRHEEASHQVTHACPTHTLTHNEDRVSTRVIILNTCKQMLLAINPRIDYAKILLQTQCNHVKTNHQVQFTDHGKGKCECERRKSL